MSTKAFLMKQSKDMEMGTSHKVVRYHFDQKLKCLRVSRYLYNPQVAKMFSSFGRAIATKAMGNRFDSGNTYNISIKAKELTSYGRKMLT